MLKKLYVIAPELANHPTSIPPLILPITHIIPHVTEDLYMYISY